MHYSQYDAIWGTGVSGTPLRHCTQRRLPSRSPFLRHSLHGTRSPPPARPPRLFDRIPGVFGIGLLTGQAGKSPKIAIRRPILSEPVDFADLVRRSQAVGKAETLRGRKFGSVRILNCPGDLYLKTNRRNGACGVGPLGYPQHHAYLAPQQGSLPVNSTADGPRRHKVR